jgi:organic radical activating enzyme
VTSSKYNSLIPIMESFYSIQGEGFHSGKPAYFIRLSGCDVNCHWCDVKESWDISKEQYASIDDIVNKVIKTSTKLVVITGGEPLMHDLSDLTTALKNEDKKIHIETSGTHPLTGDFDWICFSPKKFKKPLEIYYSVSDELKIIICNKSDFQWAEEVSRKVKKNTKLIMQPEWSREELISPLILDYIKLNPKWRISVQTHKYLNVE